MKVEYIKDIINKLNDNSARVPYTYHHDYLRMHSKRFKNLSRSDVAAEHNSNELELYAVALTYILTEMSGIKLIFHYLADDELYICREAKKITSEVIKRYNLN